MGEEKKLSYYQKNKKHYQRGGKYYKYVPKGDRASTIKVEVRHGIFLISFD
tara:strand:- start:1752 stop:1904 length:153 start_codon:yes stop_codon:yes gene_type:complete